VLGRNGPYVPAEREKLLDVTAMKIGDGCELRDHRIDRHDSIPEESSEKTFCTLLIQIKVQGERIDGPYA